MDRPVFRLPEFTIHDRLTVAEAELRPWSIDQLGVRKLGEHRGEGVTVGVVDTGVDPVHAQTGDLRRALVDAKDFTGSRFGANDQHGHGTHTAGTIAGVERPYGGVGVAPSVRLFAAKALGDDGTGSDTSVAAAIRWCIDKGCQIINMSLGSPDKSPTILAAVGEAVQQNITVCCAAGNFGDNSHSWPAMDERTVSVGATDQDRNAAPFSEPSSVDLAAPGVKILSCYKNGGYGILSGTSMASPWFAGFLAIIQSDILARGNKLLTPAEVLAMVDQWTDDIGAPGKDVKTGSGLVSAEKYRASTTPKPPTAPVEVWVPWLRFGKNALCSLKGA